MDSPFFWKACLDLLALVMHSDRYSGFLGKNVYETNPLAVRYGEDDFFI